MQMQRTKYPKAAGPLFERSSGVLSEQFLNSLFANHVSDEMKVHTLKQGKMRNVLDLKMFPLVTDTNHERSLRFAHLQNKETMDSALETSMGVPHTQFQNVSRVDAQQKTQE